MAKLDEVLCPNNRILGLMKRIQQALSPSGSTSTTSDDQGEVIRSVDTDDILERWDEVVLQLKRAHLHLFLISGFDGIEDDPVLILKPKRHKFVAPAVEDEDLADLLHVRDEKADETPGGSASGDTFNVRDLNTVVTNEISGASLTSNQITLPAGTYSIEASAPAHSVNGHQLRLRNITDTATELVGLSGFSGVDGASIHAFITGRFTISAEKVFELQHYARSAQATDGLGRVATSGAKTEIEIFADVRVKKIS